MKLSYYRFMFIDITQVYHKVDGKIQFYIPDERGLSLGIMLEVSGQNNNYYLNICGSEKKYSSSNFWKYFPKFNKLVASSDGSCCIIELSNSEPRILHKLNINPVVSFLINGNNILICSFWDLALIKNGEIIWIINEISIDGIIINKVDEQNDKAYITVENFDGELLEVIIGLTDGKIVEDNL